MSQDLPELPARVREGIDGLVKAAKGYGMRRNAVRKSPLAFSTAKSDLDAARAALESSLREWAAQLVDAEIRKRIEALPKALGLSTPDCVIVWVSRKAVMRQDLIEALCPAPKEER